MASLPGDETKLLELLRLREELERQIHGKYRKQAAVLFTDLIGSTAFYERHGDEAGRAEVARSLAIAREIIEPSGRIVKTLGDGILALFPDAESGFRAAHVLVEALSTAKLPARAALHWGELFVEEADVYGDVVNTTARLNGLASTPCVLLSRALVQALPDSSRSTCGRVGAFSVKGKTGELEVYARRTGEGDLVLDGGRLWTCRYSEASAVTVRLLRTPLWPPTAQAFACSHTSFRSHFEKLASDLPVPGPRAAWTVRTLSKTLPCWVYDLDKFGGRLEPLLAELHSWAARKAILEVALRLPHRYRAVELEVAVQTSAAFWASKAPGPSRLSLVFSEGDSPSLATAAAKGLVKGAPPESRILVKTGAGVSIPERALTEEFDGWFEGSVLCAERAAPDTEIAGT